MEEYICALCGEKIDAMDDDYEELADGKIVCISCYLHKCKRCIGCNELFRKEEMIDLDVEGYHIINNTGTQPQHFLSAI